MIGGDNNLIGHGNEFTFVPSGYSGDVYFNYRTVGGTNGNITGYILGNGAGGSLGSIIHSGNIAAQSVNYATSAGNADTVDNKHASDFTPYWETSTDVGVDNLPKGITSSAIAQTGEYNANHSVFMYFNNVGTPFQLQFPDAGENYIYKRYNSGGTWSSWEKMKAGYADSAGSASSAGNADTVDNYHASSFLKYYGSRITSATNLNDLGGYFIFPVDNASNMPITTSYGKMIDLQWENGDAYRSQLYVNQPDLPDPDRLWIRGLNSATSNWNPWKKVLFENDLGYEMSSSVVYEPSTKTVRCTENHGSWDTQAYSKTGYKNNVYVTFKVTETNRYTMIGLNSDPTLDGSYTSLDYCWYFDTTSAEIYENGSYIAGYGTLSVGDEFRIERVNGVVKYYWNGVLKREVAANSSTLYFDCSFYNGGSFSDLDFGPITQSMLPLTGGTVTGATTFNTNTNTTPLVISRDGSRTTECVAMGVDDTTFYNIYTNDEYSSAIRWTLTNTDSEGSDGSRASTHYMQINSSNTGANLYMDGDIQANYWLIGKNLSVINDSSDSGYDSMVYFRNRSNNDWAQIIDCEGADYGLDIRCSNWATYALRINGGVSIANGNLNMNGCSIINGDGSGAYYYRTNSDLKAGFYYQTSGDESVVFANKYEGAGWMFVNGIDIDNRPSWQGLTPTLQIKRGGVAINKLIGQAASPAYNLDVNGTGHFSSNLQVDGSITNLAVNGGIYWNPYVESSSDPSDAASITVVSSGAAGGTELRIQQANDSNDIINLVSPYHIYMNNKKAFSISDTWLRINEDSSGFTSGTYFGNSYVRMDNALQVGSSGQFSTNSSGQTYTDSYMQVKNCRMQYNTSEDCLDFIFA